MKKYFGSPTDEVSLREKNHQQLVREFSGECMVLLKNDGMLPLTENGKIALFGKGARRTVKGGTGSGDVYSRNTVTIEQGLINAGYQIASESWLDRNDHILQEKKEEYNKVLFEKSAETGMDIGLVAYSYRFEEPDAAEITEEDVIQSATDTAIYVISRISGEGEDRYDKEGDFRLTTNEVQGIKYMAEQYKKSIVLLNCGGYLDLSPICNLDGLNAILYCGQLGNNTGNCVADVLCGKNTPSGKLASTWGKTYCDYPTAGSFSHNDGNLDDEMYQEGIYVGYRFFDTFNVEPLYCFGYGMTYTSFDWEVSNVCQREKNIQVVLKVKNCGSYRGKEVIQIYYSAPSGSVPKAYQELASFAKTRELQPDESEELVIEFPIENMASYSEKSGAWVLEKGLYYIRVGNSSRNTKIVAVLEVAEDVSTRILTNLFQDSIQLEKISTAGIQPFSYETEETEKATAKHILLSSESIHTQKAVYSTKRQTLSTNQKQLVTLNDVLQKSATLDDLISQLTPEEMADLCVGTFRGFNFESNDLSQVNIIGNASAIVPGAAGDTSGKLLETRGIRNMIMADGPAGLRLIPHYKVNPDGTRVPGGDIAGDVAAPFDTDYITDETKDYYQYCTAIPVGSSLAQSWNEAMLNKIGNLIGKEMEEYHIDLWLAPALNIHRDPLCGRNFEYYSEDPVISGKCAAAIIQGVQCDRHVGATIKHFAANNQEDNRRGVNAHISEQALREIYLKGFEIAIKEAQPMAIMTSYNLINGVHSAANYDLLQSAARDEWGFSGMIMTDWFATVDMSALSFENLKYALPSPAEAIYAGNDLLMPGSEEDIKCILKSLAEQNEGKSKGISLSDLQFCVKNILRTLLRCEEQN